MRYLVLFTAAFFLFGAPVSADETDRNMAVKLTHLQKPEVRVFTKNERTALARQMVALDLDIDPNQIVCRKESVGPGSRLTTKRCKTRAEYREEQEKKRNLNGKVWDDQKYRDRVNSIARSRNVQRVRIRVPNQ